MSTGVSPDCCSLSMEVTQPVSKIQVLTTDNRLELCLVIAAKLQKEDLLKFSKQSFVSISKQNSLAGH